MEMCDRHTEHGSVAHEPHGDAPDIPEGRRQLDRLAVSAYLPLSDRLCNR